jgi:hypothetical protein
MVHQPRHPLSHSRGFAGILRIFTNSSQYWESQCLAQAQEKPVNKDCQQPRQWNIRTSVQPGNMCRAQECVQSKEHMQACAELRSVCRAFLRAPDVTSVSRGGGCERLDLRHSPEAGRFQSEERGAVQGAARC